MVFSQDWAELGDPLEYCNAAPGDGMKWELDWDLSDSFAYDSKDHENFQKWRDYNPTGWRGPGATLFNSDNIHLDYGKLIITPTHIPYGEQEAPYCTPSTQGNSGCNCGSCFMTRRTVHTGYVTGKKLLRFPCYTEANIKGSATSLSSNFWLKSRETEIDVNESYGDGRFNELMKTNVHFFHRVSPSQFVGGTSSLNKQHHVDTDISLTHSFNRYGTHWINETHVDFFFNGRKVRSLNLRSPDGIPDPTGKFLNEEMRVVLDLEAHHWRRHEGVPMPDELEDGFENKMIVDWVRTYRAVPNA